jgi:hypothetical protein
MKLRALYITPHKSNRRPNGSAGLSLTDPELVKVALPSPTQDLTRRELHTRFEGLALAAKALDMDIIVAAPAESYRALLEMTLTTNGLVLVYEDYIILEDGAMYPTGYRLANISPEAPRTARAMAGYDDWLNNVYSKVTESDLLKVVDPWKTYLQQQLHEMFHSPLH